MRFEGLSRVIPLKKFHKMKEIKFLNLLGFTTTTLPSVRSYAGECYLIYVEQIPNNVDLKQTQTCT